MRILLTPPFHTQNCLLALLALVSTMLGCSSSPEPLADLGPKWLEIGAGEKSFAKLSEGDPVPIIIGPQGGHMIALGLQAGGVVPGHPNDPARADNPRITYRATKVSTDELLGIVTVVHGLDEENNALELVGIWLIFNPALPTDVYFDEDVHLRVELVDARGTKLSDETTIVASAPTAAPETSAQRSIDLDVQPSEVIRRADDDTELATRKVGSAQQEVVVRAWGYGGGRLGKTAFVGHVAHDAFLGVVHAEHGDVGSVVHQKQLVAPHYAGLVDAGDVHEHPASKRIDKRVGPLHQGPGA